jgi:hypothetical protein
MQVSGVEARRLRLSRLHTSQNTVAHCTSQNPSQSHRPAAMEVIEAAMPAAAGGAAVAAKDVKVANRPPVKAP